MPAAQGPGCAEVSRLGGSGRIALVRWWIGLAAIATLGAGLHTAAIGRTLLPAQDGLKFIRAARDCQERGWLASLRATDQHPLYPLMIAEAQPVIARIVADGPDSWRIAAQGVSAVASLATLVPLFSLGRRLHGTSSALLAALLFVLLPIPMEVGHDALSDPLALLLTAIAFERGSAWLETGDRWAALACGVASGVGYWARPEVILVAGIIGGVGFLRGVCRGERGKMRLWTSGTRVLVPALALVGGYALAKGEVSEKLALRLGVGMAPSQPARRYSEQAPPIIPPKEEAEVGPRPFPSAVSEVFATWLRVTGVLLAPLVVAGACLAPPSATRAALRLYLVLFVALLIRHLCGMGYLSLRHVLAPVMLGLPWAGWRLGRLLSRVGDFLRLRGMVRGAGLATAVVAMVAGGIAAQAKPSHPSRVSHWRAGRWLTREAEPGMAVLDTHGWAAFVADVESYGAWHFRQAEADPKLAFVVVERAELESGSERAGLLQAWLGGRATLAAEFDDPAGGETGAVCVYRWHGGGI